MSCNHILELRGYIEDLKDKIIDFQRVKWVGNRTRSAILEFSVYNAQVNIFSTVTCVAEFVGGGVVPWYRIETLRYVLMIVKVTVTRFIFLQVVNEFRG